MVEQPRDPRGIPTGGQFATSERAEAGLALKPLDGSFLFPPVLNTADDIIDFWTRVEIPDEALARTLRVYRENKAMAVEEWPHYAWGWYAGHVWAAENPAPSADDPGAVADYEGRQRAAQADYEEALRHRLQDLPEELNRADARPMLRAAAMLRAAMVAKLKWPEYRRVAEHTIEFSDGQRTVAESTIESGMVGLAHRFATPENYDQDGDGVIDPPQVPSMAMSADFDWERHREIVNETVRAALEDQNAKLDDVFDELTHDLGTVAQTVVDVNNPAPPRKRRWSER